MPRKVGGMMGRELTEAKAKGKEAKGKKIGRPCKVVPVEQLKKAIEACKLGIPLDRVAILRDSLVVMREDGPII